MVFLSLSEDDELIDWSAERVMILEEYWEKKEVQSCICVVKNPVNSLDIIDASIGLLFELRERLIVLIANRINDYNDFDISIEAWKILMFPWLQFYTENMFVKYLSIDEAIKEGAEYTRIMDPSQRRTPNFWNGFWIWALFRSDYNYQLYSSIACRMNLKAETYEKKQTCNPTGNGCCRRKNNRITIREFMRRLINLFFKYADTLIVDPEDFNFSFFERLKLLIKSRGKIGFYHSENSFVDNIELDKSVRGERIDGLNNSSEYERIISETILYDIPIMYLEGIKKEWRKVSQYKCRRIITTDISSNYNKQLMLASCKNRGGKIHYMLTPLDADLGANGTESLGYAHNGADVLYTSGWNNWKYPCGLRKLTNVRLYYDLEWKKNHIVKKKYDVLIALDFFYRRKTVISCFTAPMNHEFINFSTDLVRRFYRKTSLNVVTRFFPFGKDENKYLIDQLGKEGIKIEVDDNQNGLVESIMKSRICVVNMLISSPWVEAIALDCPVIIIIPKCFEYYSEHGKKIAETLKKANMYFNSIEEALEVINKIDDIEKWWADKAYILRDIKDKYCWVSNNIKDEWINEFIRASSE